MRRSARSSGTAGQSPAAPRSQGGASRRPSTAGTSEKDAKKPKKFKLIDYPRTGKRGFRRWVPSWRQFLRTSLAVAALGIGVILATYYNTDIPAANDFVTEATNKVYYDDDDTDMESFA